jgi:hypothetical protein
MVESREREKREREERASERARERAFSCLFIKGH